MSPVTLQLQWCWPCAHSLPLIFSEPRHIERYFLARCALVVESACAHDAVYRVLRNLYEAVCLDDTSFANMLAGHMAMLVLTCLIFISASMGPALNGSLTVASVLFNIFMNGLNCWWPLSRRMYLPCCRRCLSVWHRKSTRRKPVRRRQ